MSWQMLTEGKVSPESRSLSMPREAMVWFGVIPTRALAFLEKDLTYGPKAFGVLQTQTKCLGCGPVVLGWHAGQQ